MAGSARDLIFIDTNIAIELRDGHPPTLALISTLEEKPRLPFITRIELESGVHRDRELATARRSTLDLMLRNWPVVPLTEDDVLAYGRIVAASGFDRRRVLDRLIAAQALVRGGRLITRNPRDFRDIHGLSLIEW